MFVPFMHVYAYIINKYTYIYIHIYACLSARLRRKIKGKCAQMCIYIIYIYVYTILYNIHAVRERESGCTWHVHALRNVKIKATTPPCTKWGLASNNSAGWRCFLQNESDTLRFLYTELASRQCISNWTQCIECSNNSRKPTSFSGQHYAFRYSSTR